MYQSSPEGPSSPTVSQQSYRLPGLVSVVMRESDMREALREAVERRRLGRKSGERRRSRQSDSRRGDRRGGDATERESGRKAVSEAAEEAISRTTKRMLASQKERRWGLFKKLSGEELREGLFGGCLGYERRSDEEGTEKPLKEPSEGLSEVLLKGLLRGCWSCRLGCR
ncbi:hypothetical protein BDZ91DRAFT_765219 [Kalaharituber pfeilii]|nr:hypothetical protein BDZ91DRAFT_765219 [Kalaharituber pfeilii]